MATQHPFIEPDPERENVWRIVVPVVPQHRVKIFPDYGDGTREEIERRLDGGEELGAILTDPNGNISF